MVIMCKFFCLVCFVVFVLFFFVLVVCKMEVFKFFGDVVECQKDLFLILIWLMFIIIILVMLLIVLFVWCYCVLNKNVIYKFDWDYLIKFELVIWVVLLLIVICFGVMIWVGMYLLDLYCLFDRIVEGQLVFDQDLLCVEVVVLDWKWLFIYFEQGIVMVNEMVVLVDREVEFSLILILVMNVFYIFVMVGMIYVMLGMEIKLYGVFNNFGEYQGFVLYYLGVGFFGMCFKVYVVDQVGFDVWVDEVCVSGVNLDCVKFLELEMFSENVKFMFFGEVDLLLFDRIVNMCVEDGKICMVEMMVFDV